MSFNVYTYSYVNNIRVLLTAGSSYWLCSCKYLAPMVPSVPLCQMRYNDVLLHIIIDESYTNWISFRGLTNIYVHIAR